MTTDAPGEIDQTPAADDRPAWAPASIATDRPNPSRVYDALLGGAHNFAVDREMAHMMRTARPETLHTVRANRAFMRRAVVTIARAGVRQFIDLGSGLPTVGSVHEIAAEVSPDPTVVYVDHDPVAVAHSTVILADHPRVAALHADLRELDKILADEQTRDLIDFSRPVGVLLVAVLHFIPDGVTEIVDSWYDVVSPGSYLAISHVAPPRQMTETDVRAVRDYRQATGAELTLRSQDQIEELFGHRWTLIEPGVCPPAQWRPDSSEVSDVDTFSFAGVAVKRGD